jgi:hypothetical protein
MKKQTALLLILFFISIISFSSCATILNAPTQRIYIRTDSTIKQVIVDKATYIDSFSNTPGMCKAYYVVRNKMPLIIILKSDSIEKKIFLKPINSFAYWWNIEWNYGLGMLIDKDNPKRYGYRKKNYFSFKDSTFCNKRFISIPKKAIDISLSLSPINVFNVRANNELYSSGSIFGAEAGLDYYYTEKQFISIAIGSSGNEHSFVDHIGGGFIEWERVSYVNLRNNTVIGDFSLGYGLNISKFEWGEYLNGNSLNSSDIIANTAVGLSFFTQYRLGQYLHLGFIYQPDFYSLNSLGWNYQDYAALSFIWKFPINNR